MKLSLYTAALVTVAALVSCSASNENEYIDKSVIPAASETNTTQPVSANTAPASTAIIPGATPVNFNPNTININPQTNNVVTAPQSVTTQQPAAVAAGMNPAHGQPGHRCDIAVGAPLNSKPAPANVQPTTVSAQAPPQITTTQVPTTQKTAPGMNPPHGEPNHRCDIAVGAPLNSKPAPATNQPANATSAPVVTTAQPAAQKTAPGMNPPHGEPNHRCDIAVGAPLNSKPAAPAAATAQTTVPPALLTAPKTDSSKN